MRYPMAVLDMKGVLDDTIPANTSNGFYDGGPHGSTWSSDDFWYTPTENLTQAWSEVNQCEGPEHAYHYR
jgi:poly(3-hydroxybutyrate) depolymerase